MTKPFDAARINSLVSLLWVPFGAVGQKELRNILVAVANGVPNGGHAVAGKVRVGGRFEQQLDDLGMATTTRPKQGRGAAAILKEIRLDVANIGINAACQELAHRAGIAVASRFNEPVPLRVRWSGELVPPHHPRHCRDGQGK